MRRLKFIEAVMRWKWYPDIFRIPVLIGFFYLIYVLLFGEQAEGDNNGLSVMWVLLWALQPVLFVLFGRFFCGVCPFGYAGDAVQKMVGNEFHPPLFLKKYGVWFAYAFFIMILLIETMVHMASSTAASSILLLTIFTLAVISGAFFRRRTWCRYLCPLGVAGGVFSRLRVIKLSKDDKSCSECKKFECLQGTEKSAGCPMSLCIRKHDLDADCISCGNCLKNCPSDSPRIELHSPVKGFLSNVKLNQAESVFASSFIGFSIALYLIKDYLEKINRIIGFENSLWNKLLVIVLFTGLSFLLFYLFSFLIRPITRQSQKYNFRFFGFFLIPCIFFALVNLTSIRGVPLMSVQGKHILQGLFILAGSALSVVFCLHELRKIHDNRQRNLIAAIFSIFLVLLAGYSLYLFLFL